jgi:urease gamma subunit
MSLAHHGSRDAGVDDRLLSESFDRRTLLDMEVALDRACSGLPLNLRSHESRTFIAARIIQCVQDGAATQDAMTRAALDAVEELEKNLR